MLEVSVVLLYPLLSNILTALGLGSRLPWDKKFLVESLSDSTVYMAYYTIAHFLHKDLFGKEHGIFKIKPEQMTDSVWDYIVTRRELDDALVRESGIPKVELETLRRQLEYWYPLDMRVSGKDLIPNHLTFCLYIHAALFPKKLWPRSIRCNGHLLLNGTKMSKSKGNFLTLNEACNKYGADATRVRKVLLYPLLSDILTISGGACRCRRCS